MKDEKSIALVFRCTDCHARDLITKVYRRPTLVISRDFINIHGDATVEVIPRSRFHLCSSKNNERVYGVSEFVAYVEKDW